MFFYLFQAMGGGFKIKKRYDDFLHFTKSSYHLVIIVSYYHCNQTEFTGFHSHHSGCESLLLLAMTCSIMDSLASRQSCRLIASVISLCPTTVSSNKV